MASIHRREGRKPHQVRWRDASGNEHKKSFERLGDARSFRNQVEEAIRSGVAGDSAAGKLPFAAYADRWFALRTYSENYARNIRSHLAIVVPHLGDVTVKRIRPSDIQALVKALSVERSVESVKTILKTVKVILNAAEADGDIPRNPCSKVTLPPAMKRQVIPLTEGQVQALLDAMPPRYKATAMVAALSGLREGETLGLQLPHIKFLKKVLHVEGQVQPLPGGTRWVPTKSNRRRVVPIGADLTMALSEHIRAFPPNGDDYVFTTAGGNLVHAEVFRRAWTAARVAAAEEYGRRARATRNLEEAAELRARATQLASARFHDLRHFYASALIQEGLSVVTVAARLGHATPAITLQVYSHLWPGEDDRTRTALENRLKIKPDVARLRPVVGE